MTEDQPKALQQPEGDELRGPEKRATDYALALASGEATLHDLELMQTMNGLDGDDFIPGNKKGRTFEEQIELIKVGKERVWKRAVDEGVAALVREKLKELR